MVVGESIAVPEHADRMRLRAHQRYAAALKALATVRKLDLPSIRINLTRRQINVAGNLAPDGVSSVVETEGL
jgi:hypothetical protein